MLLSHLLVDVEHERIGDDVDISEIEYDSRKVQPGDLFCCIVGTFSDGHAYASQAIESGAKALLVQRKLDVPIPQVIVKDTRAAMALMAAQYYGHPAKKLIMVGITGTNGKTTTTYMLKYIAEHAGHKVGLIGTIRNMIGDRVLETDRTTPESVDLHKILRQMCDEGVQVVMMEVSSHSLDQRRVYGVTFDVAEFTNLTQDHMDYHKTLENYLNAKKQLFYQSNGAVINADDPHSKELMEGLTLPIMTFGVREKADITATEIDITTRGVQFDLNTPGGVTRMHIPIPGLFSVFNAIGAVGVALMLGYPMEAIKSGLEDMSSVPGRLEPLPTGGRPFSVLLDYAHTPDALENILKTVRGFAKGRIITLFGCGGDRDRAKRPIMGEVAGRYSDYLVVTSDNPRTEDPFAILRSIEEGVKKSGCEYIIIENRLEAIRYALSHAREDDVVILAGKGHESYQEINGMKHHFDEKEITAQLLDEMPL
ncbi:MAG: UDP-N-acetylmuramoyl-L-alanyl-D-glutamate--2,6-diaminopimelate ligase [Bacillota bacterium]